jgi:xanthine/uracil permease
MLKHLRTFTPVISGLVLLSIGVFFGEIWGWYDHIANFDKVLHVSGGVIAAWFVLTLFQNDIPRMVWWKQLLVLVGITTLIGVVWEWAEFASNFTQHTYPGWYHYFHGGDLADTIGDLVADVTGAVVLSLWVLRRERS